MWGHVFSPECKQCTTSGSADEALKKQVDKANELASSNERCIECYLGSDQLCLMELLGLAGPSGTHFCIFCEATLSGTRRTGVPQLRQVPDGFIFPEGATTDPRSLLERLPPDRPGTEELARLAQSYIDAMRVAAESAGKEPEQANYKNVVRPPLVWSNSLKTLIGGMPLHIDLGIMKLITDHIEDKAEELDRQMALAEGSVPTDVKEKLKAIDDKLTEAELTIEEHTEEKMSLSSAMRIILTKVPGVDRRRKAKGEPLVALYIEHKAALAVTLEALAKEVKEVQELEAERTVLLDAMAPNGTFTQAVNTVYKVQRVNKRAYHSQSWVGPDISKLLNPTRNEDPADLFHTAMAPRSVTTPTGGVVTIGTAQWADQMKSVLISFREVRSLYSRVEPLCDHQLDSFDSLVEKFMVDYFTLFPGDKGTPKMHTLGYHYGDIMRIFGSVGQFTEQVIEAYHVVDKRMKERFANVAEPAKQQACRINVATHTSAAKLDMRAQASTSGAKARATKKMLVASKSRKANE